MGQHFVLIIQFDSKHSPGQHRRNGAFEFYGLFAGQIICSGLLPEILSAGSSKSFLLEAKNHQANQIDFDDVFERKQLLFCSLKLGIFPIRLPFFELVTPAA